jgi:ATP-dependent exoDNAse (exonuclease V) alpha subunit
MDHGYAVTAHKSQGLDSQNVIYVTDTAKKQLNTTQSFYVAISRAQNNATIITNNISVLQNQVKRPQQKTSTLDFSPERVKTQDRSRKKGFER